jgi:hypothetical protein
MQVDGHLAIRHVGVGHRQYGFLLESGPVKKNGITNTGVKPYSSWLNTGVEETAVFPGQVEIMEGEKHVIPSRIWLQIFDSSLVDIGEPLYLFQSGITPTARRSQKFSLTLPDGKISIGEYGGPVSGRQCACQEIEAAADAVNKGARFRANKRIKGLDLMEAIDFLSGLRFGIYPDGVGFAPPFDGTFHEDWDLGYGPIDCSFSV